MINKTCYWNKTSGMKLITEHWINLRINRNIQSCHYYCTKMDFSIKEFFNKCDQIRMKFRIWSHLLKKSFMENFTFCAVY